MTNLKIGDLEIFNSLIELREFWHLFKDNQSKENDTLGHLNQSLPLMDGSQLNLKHLTTKVTINEFILLNEDNVNRDLIEIITCVEMDQIPEF